MSLKSATNNGWGYSGTVAVHAPAKPFRVGSNRKITSSDVDEMVKLRRSGKTLAQIARTYGVSYGTAQYRLSRIMTPSEYQRLSLDCKRSGRIPVTKAERNAEIVAMRLSGSTVPVIAAHFGLSRSTVSDLCQRYLPIEVTESVRQRRRWQLDDPVVVEALDHFRSGLSIRQSANLSRMPISCLWRAINKIEAIELGQIDRRQKK